MGISDRIPYRLLTGSGDVGGADVLTLVVATGASLVGIHSIYLFSKVYFKYICLWLNSKIIIFIYLRNMIFNN